MNVVLFNTDDSRGGAARSALRLHDAFRAQNIPSIFLVRNKIGTSEAVISVAQSDPIAAQKGSVAQQYYVNARRSALTNTLLSVGYPNVPVASHSVVQQADILNLHWVTNFLGPAEIHGLIATTKPVVWTMHDQWPMTGGCHYTAGCRQFTEACTICPQLTEDPAGLVPSTFQDKLDARFEQITVVTPSKWMASEARASRLFRNSRIEVIPYSLDVDAFAPQEKAEVRAAMGIPADAFVFLFACSAAGEARKGGEFLKEIVTALSESPDLRSSAGSGNVWLLCFGWETNRISTKRFAEKHLGFLQNDVALRNAYTAADVLLHLSTEDNLPNTVLESMACGTPVLAADAGGARDMIGENQCGWLLPTNDVAAFARQIATLIERRELLREAGANARRKMLEHYTPRLQASRYAKLFSELLACPRSAAKGHAATRVSSQFPLMFQQGALDGIAKLEQEKRELEKIIHRHNDEMNDLIRRKELEVQAVQKHLENVKRNIGYRMAHGITLKLKGIEKAIRGKK